jgi:hypothetical protein
LQEEVTFEQLVASFKKLKVAFDGNQLYDEFATLRRVRPVLNEAENRSDLKWVNFFETYDSPQLLKLVKYVFSIPISTAAVERLFSIMLNLWTNERNRLSMEVVKAEICCRIHFKKSCLEFAEWIKNQQSILVAASLAASADRKYIFKKKISQ